MLSSRFLRSAAITVATLVGAGTVSLLGASSALAASGGSITFSQATGQDTTDFSVSTPAACPSGDPDVQIVVTGGNFPTSPIVFADTKGPISAWPTNADGGLDITFGNSLRTLAQNAQVTLLDPAAPAPTEYTVDVQCTPLFGASDEDFSGNLWFTSETAFTTVNPATPATPTSTAVVASPVSPTTVGSPVTLTATVSPAAAAGTVTFYNGTSALGAAATVTNGAATLVTTGLGIGTHAITAAFTPANAAVYATSTSAVLSYVVNPAAATPTSTSLLVAQGSSAEQFSEVTLDATVSPATAAGSVQFLSGATVLGSAPVVNGQAQYNTSTLAVGTYGFTADFVPTDPTVYLASATAAAVPFQVTAFTGSSSTETITTTVLPGSLVISIPDQQVTLPSPVLNSSGNLFTTSGALQPITVTDNRAGNPGWTVSGLVSAFTDGTTQINAENLGWTPTAATGSAGQTITEGPVVAPAAGVAPSDTGTAGLASAQTLAAAAAGAGLGTAHLGANLQLNVPTTTTAGTYTATLTLTAI
ncbi:MAG TPA: Ig-like domain-containing protein [Actinocrinis sp.]|nr:Ig-like domain-containing protein [Actinocrinis sp.]